MGNEKDILEKHLESYNDVFSDMMNVFIFDGNEVINEDELEDVDPNSYYVENSKTKEQERDVTKKWIKKNVIISFMGFENQTKVDNTMPLRVMSYDGASYKYMLASEIPPCPVITFVLNFSMQKWAENKTILECLNVDDSLKPFVSDYKINVVDVAYLSRETVNKFKSDFKIIADYFVQMRETGEYKPMTDEVKHIWEVLLLMSKLTKDDRFKVQYYSEHREEPMNMCEWLDKVENRGIAKGIAEGIAKGEYKTAVKNALTMLKDGLDIEKTSLYSGLPIEEVVALSKQIEAVSV
ncbi:MAG: Rpn family recombination-promoting nuclease/putative transposase [Firmicutes bacterium]|nr:Rpn family recombination-promoting nuclease/putative transposase [Bacillota bacterium]